MWLVADEVVGEPRVIGGWNKGAKHRRQRTDRTRRYHVVRVRYTRRRAHEGIVYSHTRNPAEVAGQHRSCRNRGHGSGFPAIVVTLIGSEEEELVRHQVSSDCSPELVVSQSPLHPPRLHRTLSLPPTC